MLTLTRLVLAPAVRAWVASKTDEVESCPRARDTPEWHSPGVDSDRVLLFGGGPAVGWGVLSHALALTGSLGRVLSRRTHRGADIYTVPIPGLKVAAARTELGRVGLEGYDAVILTLGVNDAAALTSLASWEHHLSGILRMLARRCPRNARIFVAGVHPLRSIPVYDGPLGSIADSHARKMNAITARLCAELRNVTFVELTAPEPGDALRFRDARSYRHWAEELAEVMAPQLNQL